MAPAIEANSSEVKGFMWTSILPAARRSAATAAARTPAGTPASPTSARRNIGAVARQIDDEQEDRDVEQHGKPIDGRLVGVMTRFRARLELRHIAGQRQRDVPYTL